MKRIVDWSQRKDGEEDTTGWSKSLIANYVSILAIAGNPSWKKEIKQKKISLDQYQDVTVQLLSWIFSNVTDEDIKNSRTTAEEYWKVAVKADERDFKFGDSVLEAAGKRRFRASQVLRSIVSHLGVSDFQEAEFDSSNNIEIIYPLSLEVNWNESWTNFRGIAFSKLVGFLKTQVKYECLEIKVGSGSEQFCSQQIGSTQESESATFEGKQASVDDLAPQWGAGTYILFYGPPGTGKTREANKLIQDTLAKQLEISSDGEIRKQTLNGEWTPKFRETVMRELRKFITVCQFHSTYSYEDFIEGLRPLSGEDSDVRYEVVDGSFLAIWRKATGKSANLKAKFVSQGDDIFLEIDPYFISLYDLDIETSVDVFVPSLEQYFSGKHVAGSNWLKTNMTSEEFGKIQNGKLIPVSLKGDSWSPSNQYFVLVDEINRGKVSKIFGELLFAMSASGDDKYPEVRTQYSKTPLVLVQNLSMLGTMNSCDKSVDVLDQALKRRFELRELMPLNSSDLAHDGPWKKMVSSFEDISKINLAHFLDGLNAAILDSKQVDYDRQIGHSYLFKINSEVKEGIKNKPSEMTNEDLCLRAIFKIYFADIFPVLQDFFLDRRDLLEKFVPKGLIVANSHALKSEVRRLLSAKSILDYDIETWKSIEQEFRKTIVALQISQSTQKRSA
ncbi:MAG: hypothetical protein KF802_08255 [Bdellovibrionaceae bacterium]|nr:hypothetical protein [Pseudobdellovibrionaceae bacterium]